MNSGSSQSLQRFAILLFFSLPFVNLVELDCFAENNRPDHGAGDWTTMKSVMPRGYVCGRTTTPIVVDGRLDDSGWSVAPWTEDFVDIEADLKPKPRLRTRAKLLWDDNYLYIAAELSDPHVQGTVTEHDAVIFQDNDFEVFIDPNSDNHHYYELELNARNTTWDLYLPRPYKDGGSADNSFELIGLKTATHVDGTINDPTDTDKGWSVEIAIPWKAIPHRDSLVAPRNGDRWRIDFSRVEWQFKIVNGKYEKVPNTKEDNWVWSPQGIVDMHRPERWGYVLFSDEKPGTSPFIPDPTQRQRDLLMEVYHRQRAFHAANARWAKSLEELAFPLTDVPSELDLRMMSHAYGFDASMKGTNSQRVNIRQDSFVWESNETERVIAALERAGKNTEQLQQALAQVPSRQREALDFLIAYMPQRDLSTLTSSFLLENVQLAYDAWDEAPWKDKLPKDVFFNNVLPYANINESRDPWRKDFRTRFKSLIDGAQTPSAAAAMLNQKLFGLVNVRYSTQRKKADQSPIESMKSGLASCTGLSVLLIDACRAFGIPARFVGTPLWSDGSGNHSWVEVWDDGWHFTGAAEPSGDKLDQAWFVGRAATAKRDDVMNAIYAVSYQHTPIHFPLVWDRSIDYIYAVNVTDRYIDQNKLPSPGTVNAMFRTINHTGGPRVAASIQVRQLDGKVLFDGTTKDERFDANDHVSVNLPLDNEFEFVVRFGGKTWTKRFRSSAEGWPITLPLDELPVD